MQPKPQKGSQGGLTEAWCHAGPPEGPNHRLAPWAPTWQEQGRRCSRRLPVWTFTMGRHSTIEVGRAEVFDSTVPRGPHGNRPREFLRRRRPVTRSDHRHHLRIMTWAAPNRDLRQDSSVWN